MSHHSEGDALLQARRACKSFGSGPGIVRAVHNVDLRVAGGETVAITGPSGCGKSTLLHLLSGLDRPSSGEIWLTGRRLDQLSERALAKLRRTTVGFVFQAFHLIDELTALENVELPMLLAGRPSVGARRRAIELLGSVGLAHRTEHLPAALSGGEQQRVAIARAVSNEPTVIFADEPTGNLDSHATADVLELLQALHGSGRTLILATHDPAVAATAGRVLAMRDGSLLAESTPHGT